MEPVLELTNTSRFSEDLRRRSKNASVVLRAPTTLTSRIFRNASRFGLARETMPALLTRISSLPCWDAIWAAAASTDLSSVTSIWTQEAVPLISGRDCRALADSTPLAGSREPRITW